MEERNTDKIINAIKEKGRKRIRIPQQYFNVEIRVDTDYGIEFYTELIAPKHISIKDNSMGHTLLKFDTHNITWVSDEDTEKILKIIHKL